MHPGAIGCARALGHVYRQKFLNLSGASSVYLTVCWMFLWPSHACSTRVSCPTWGSRAFRATRRSLAPTMLLSNRWRKRRDRLLRRRVLRDPLLAGQLCGRLNDIAMPLLSLDLGGGFSVDSVCHLRDRPGLAIQRAFDELFSNAPHFADALWIVLVNRLCEHNSQLISKLLFARQPA